MAVAASFAGRVKSFVKGGCGSVLGLVILLPLVTYIIQSLIAAITQSEGVYLAVLLFVFFTGGVVSLVVHDIAKKAQTGNE